MAVSAAWGANAGQRRPSPSLHFRGAAESNDKEPNVRGERPGVLECPRVYLTLGVYVRNPCGGI